MFDVHLPHTGKIEPTNYPALSQTILDLMLGPQTWMAKRFWQVAAAGSRERERLSNDGPADYEYYERLRIFEVETILLSLHHVQNMRTLRAAGKQRSALDTQLSKHLTFLTALFHASHVLLGEQFGETNLIGSTDRLALTKAIFYTMDGFTVDEAEQDAEALRQFFSTSGAV